MNAQTNFTKKTIRNVVFVLVFLLLSNFSYLFRKWVIHIIAPDDALSFQYTTLHGELRPHESVYWNSGLVTYSMVKEYFDRFTKCHPTTQDTILYRTFKKEPWQFWNWLAFFVHPRYQLPYIDPAKVPKVAAKRPPTLCPGEF